MPIFSSSDVLGAVERRLQDVAGAESPTSQAFVLSEAVMWLWMLGESFGALALLVGDDRGRLNALFFARHKGLHEAIVLSEVSDRFSDYLTEMYGSPIWTKLPPARSTRKNQAEESTTTGGYLRAAWYWIRSYLSPQHSERPASRGGGLSAAKWRVAHVPGVRG